MSIPTLILFIPKDSSPTQYYWYRSTLMSSPSVNEPEQFNFPIGLALVIAWTVIYLCMVQGITESGKVVYVTAIFPYVVLIIFFFRGITLKGATDGIETNFLFTFRLLQQGFIFHLHRYCPSLYTTLGNTNGSGRLARSGNSNFLLIGWDLCYANNENSFLIYIIVSGLAFGGLIAFSSYNPANNNCYRDALLVSFTNCGTSMFAGVVVFSIIGFKATATFDECNEANTIAGQELKKCSLQDELSNSASGTGDTFLLFNNQRTFP